MFGDIFHHKHLVMKYEYQDKLNYVMFADIELLRTRLDNTEMRESLNQIAVIFSAKVFKAEIDDKKEAIMSQLIIVNSIVIL